MLLTFLFLFVLRIFHDDKISTQRKTNFFDCRVTTTTTTTIQFNSIQFIMGVGPSSESHKAQYNVAVLGAAGGIGQTLSLLMKQSKFIKSLRLCAFSRVSQIFILLMVLSFPTHQKIPLDDDPIFTVTVFVVVFLFLFFFLCYEYVI